MKIRKNKFLSINVINVNNGNFEIGGQINCVLSPKKYSIYYTLNGKRQKLDINDSNKYARYSLNELILTNKTFKLVIPKKKINKHAKNSLSFEIKYDGEYYQLTPNFFQNGRLKTGLRLHYIKDELMITQKRGIIYIEDKTLTNCLKMELAYYLQLLKKGKINVICYRLLANITRCFEKKKIWLISDRTTVANDNGMHFFKYANSVADDEIKTYFVIKKETQDYHEMKKYGKVVDYNSLKYKILFLLSDKIISSQADAWVTNCFGNQEMYYRDMYRFDFIFLQHGVTKNDQTNWLNYYNKNIKMLVTVSHSEYESFVNNKEYGYDKNVIKLTGFPRYDNLQNDCKKLVAIMPTWRHWLGGKVNEKDGTREYNEEFKESAYYNFYNKLINDKDILKCMKEKNYSGIFVVHPSHMTNAKDFEGNEIFKIVDGYADYQMIFKQADLLISDYSSVPFDFAYLYKPVIYAEFDREEFYAKHIYKEGYFEPKRDGFGPVTEDYETTKKEIIEYIESDCLLEKKYINRTNKFYKYTDQNNCKRVYKEIKKMDKLNK